MVWYQRVMNTTIDTFLPAGGYVSDGGLETDLIFNHGVELPEFASFPLVEHDTGRDLLRAYYDGYAEVARRAGAGLTLESPTWRANADWGAKVGYDAAALARANTAAIGFLQSLRDGYAGLADVRIIGSVGPRGDGYVAGDRADPDEAADYHTAQVGALARAGADVVVAYTLTGPEEGIGVVRAAAAAGIPAAVSFTVETDGRLPTGQPLHVAIEQVDAETSSGAAYFMVNCAHPTHFADALGHDGAWRSRIGGLRANASSKSHAELDESTELDEGDPDDLGARHAALRDRLPAVTVLGGCCGTDARHVAAICAAWSTQ